MVFEGSFTIPHDSTQFRMVAEESIAGWYTPCEGGEPTLTPTPDATETPMPTDTPDPGGDHILYLPFILYAGGGQLPTATPVPSTATPKPPTATPTQAPTSYTIECNDHYDFEKVDEEAKFEFSAIAYKNGIPLEDVDLEAELDPGAGPSKSKVEETNFNGVADFQITV